MKTLITCGIVVAVIGVIIACVPALKGPINRAKHNVNDTLNAEYVVDNLKEEYIKLNDKSVQINNDIQKIECEIKVCRKKIEAAEKIVETNKAALKNAGTADMKKFALLKDAYEVSKINVENMQLTYKTYLGAKKKLEDAFETVKITMSKAKTNIAQLEAKKTVIDNLKAVNKTLANINGIGTDDTKIGMNIEKLDDDLIRAETENSIYNAKPTVKMTEEDAKKFLESL